ncbi:MAG: Hsp20/alpha crystallin family protein [Flavisolibacter sp.]|jgi:HSP20 family protein|nr:Hsp20/alpha crystallin family protein [Flavisolibacter sp.]
MTVVRFKNRPNGAASFNNLLSDVFPQMPSLYRDEARQTIPINIKETEKEFLIELVAPGLNKEDFGISLEDSLLTISAEKKEEAKNENEKTIRAEYKFASFKRSFTTDEKVNAEGITAQYVNGVLIVNLPKKEEVKPAIKNITIA